MQRRSQTAWLVGALGITLMLAPGCSKQMETKSDSAELEAGTAQRQEAAPPGGGDGPVKGFESAALGNVSSEERVSEPIIVAKAEPSAAASQQAEEMRKEQAATALAALQDIFFTFDSWKITEEGQQALSFDAQWLKDNQEKRLTVEGHCDERGTQAYNLVLGEKRARAVRAYLVELGVAADRVTVASLGKERPFCQEHAESCYQQNRRVHVVLRGQ